MSLFHRYLDAAQQASLTKNEWRVFNVILKKTIGYCKSSDAINSRQWKKECPDLRADRRNEAITRLVDKGLLEVMEHEFYDYEYFIPDCFLDEAIICPFIPPHSQKPTRKKPKQPHNQARHTRKKGVYKQKELTEINNTTTVTETIDVSANTETKTELPTPESSGCGLKIPITLPESLHYPSLQMLKHLPQQQAQACLNILATDLQAGKVRKPLAYLYALAKAASNNALTLPDTSYANTSNPASIKPSSHALHIERSNQLAERQHLAKLAQWGNVSLESLGG